jgi:hypothetical protein
VSFNETVLTTACISYLSCKGSGAEINRVVNENVNICGHPLRFTFVKWYVNITLNSRREEYGYNDTVAEQHYTFKRYTFL